MLQKWSSCEAITGTINKVNWSKSRDTGDLGSALKNLAPGWPLVARLYKGEIKGEIKEERSKLTKDSQKGNISAMSDHGFQTRHETLFRVFCCIVALSQLSSHLIIRAPLVYLPSVTCSSMRTPKIIPWFITAFPSMKHSICDTVSDQSIVILLSWTRKLMIKKERKKVTVLKATQHFHDAWNRTLFSLPTRNATANKRSNLLKCT